MDSGHNLLKEIVFLKNVLKKNSTYAQFYYFNMFQKQLFLFWLNL